MGKLTGRILAIALTGSLMAGQPVYAVTPGDGVPGQAAGRGPSTCPVMLFERTESACDAGEDLSPAGSGDISGIKAPRTEDGVSTWDCIWFGRYWQDTDSNEDGSVTREDNREPIKWRVLDVDEEGNAVLLSDKLLDIIEYDTRYYDDEVSWEKSILRSFLNCYDENYNGIRTDFSETGFINNAFTASEKNAIKLSALSQKDSYYYAGNTGGIITEDRIYCLSIVEALNADYGFLTSELTLPENKPVKYSTGADDSRKAVVTAYASEKQGYEGPEKGTYGDWWLRTVGRLSTKGFVAGADGTLDIESDSRLNSISVCVRPALCLNLKKYTAFWSNAGTVSSKGIVTERAPSWEEKSLDDIVLEDPPDMSVGESRTLIPEFIPADAADQSVIWKSEDQDTVSVDAYGVIKGIREGTAVITATASGDHTARCTVRITPTIKKPCKLGIVSTWNCIWFGRYWQQTDLRDEGLSIIEDYKAPIKWRVLDIDEDGVALLLSDDSLERTAFNTDSRKVFWDGCTLRSFLNSYDSAHNVCETDFTGTGFFDNAFTEEEAEAILPTHLNSDNTVHDRKAGDETDDKVFCLSAEEATDERYGFGGNGFIDSYKSMTDADATRKCHHGLYYAHYNYEWWWLRTRGINDGKAAYVDQYGGVDISGFSVDKDDDNSGRDPLFRHDITVRPAIRLNLEEHKDLWSYAGTVRSDGIKGEIPAPSGINLPEKISVLSGNAVTITPGFVFDDLAEKKLTWKSSDEEVAIVDENGVVEGKSVGTCDITVEAVTEANTAVCTVSVVEIDSPKVEDDTSSWDCVYFGDYRQRDKNCAGAADAPDEKDPIKWRVLDLNEEGDALLLSDRILEYCPFNLTADSGNLNWGISTLRSYLNCYGKEENICLKDYSFDGFFNNAFAEEERDLILPTDLVNKADPVFGTSGGEDTTDKVFCLSRDESMTAKYGFVRNEYTLPEGGSSLKWQTFPDPSRVAELTGYVADKQREMDTGSNSSWWLRSPAESPLDALCVKNDGTVSSLSNDNRASRYLGVRPALRVNLNDSAVYWDYAGKVFSDNRIHVTGVDLPENEEVRVGNTVTLTPEIIPSDADDKAVSWESSDEKIATVSENGVVTGVSPGFADITVTSNDGGHTAVCRVRVRTTWGHQVNDPVTKDGVSTWDCVWFGNYWQDTDSDVDGKVTRNDSKDPIKWRVLDVDDDGNAFLLSDLLLDIMDYNESSSSVTWKDSSIRTFLNNRSAGSEGFLKDAFSVEEIGAIDSSDIENRDNTVYGTDGGEDTVDKVFCLSLEEAKEPSFGFIENDYSEPDSAKVKYYTPADNTRKAVTTAYTAGKEGFLAGKAGAFAHWWLRSPGDNGTDGAYVGSTGSVHANSSVYYGRVCVRPAIRLNLADHPEMWSKAGKVSSDGSEEPEQKIPVKGVSVYPETAEIYEGESVSLKAQITPIDASDKGVTWTSSDETIAKVDTNGGVKGISHGDAVIWATTRDGGHSASCRVRVRRKASPDDDDDDDQEEKLDVDEEDLNITMIPGEIKRLNVNRDGHYIYGIRWTADTEPKNCISCKNGIVTAKKTGTAVVTATYRDSVLTFNIRVDGTVPQNISVKAGKNSYKLTAPKQKKLTVGSTGTVAVSLSQPLRGAAGTVSCRILKEGVCTVSEPVLNSEDRSKASKAYFTITPVDAGATYLEWSMENEIGITVKAFTKVIVKKPLTELKVEGSDETLRLSAGKGVRLKVIGTKDNTDHRAPAFSVNGTGIRVSETGYVSAVHPGSQGVVTVRSGRINSTVNITVDSGEGQTLALRKSSLKVKPPKKENAKPKTVSVKIGLPSKKSEQPALAWSVLGDHPGLSVNEGVVSVEGNARPGCYIIKAKPVEEDSSFNTVTCELLVQ